MIVLNTINDADVYPIPLFIRNRLSFLLSIFDDNSLDRHGAVIIPETEPEVNSISLRSLEFTEKIICGDSVYWHLIIPRNNSFCEEYFIQQDIMSVSLLRECEANNERTVHDYEI